MQKRRFSIQDFFYKNEHNQVFMWFGRMKLKKYGMQNFIFPAVEFKDNLYNH